MSERPTATSAAPRGWLALGAALLLGACSAAPVAPLGLSADAVLHDSPLAAAAEDARPDASTMLVVSPPMREFIDRHVDRSGNESERLGELVRAIIGGDRFRLAYDDSTRDAAGTFEHRRGNCLSFTSMFIAMARELGLDARFQEVEIPPDWSMSGQAFLISEHVNALVEVRNAMTRVVDFNSYEFRAPETGVEISDARARAHFFSNIGVEHMLAGEVGAAYANLRRSLEEDPTFSAPWVNMGILHRREGYPDHAELAFLQALEHDRDNLMAMSNLANLYSEQGDEAKADRYLRRVRSHRLQNPYFRYQVANEAFAEGDYDTAIDNLKVAIRQLGEEDRFYHLLSLSYLMRGDRDEARHWMQKAEEVAQRQSSKDRYHHKLELLMGRDAG